MNHNVPVSAVVTRRDGPGNGRLNVPGPLIRPFEIFIMCHESPPMPGRAPPSFPSARLGEVYSQPVKSENCRHHGILPRILSGWVFLWGTRGMRKCCRGGSRTTLTKMRAIADEGASPSAPAYRSTCARPLAALCTHCLMTRASGARDDSAHRLPHAVR